MISMLFLLLAAEPLRVIEAKPAADLDAQFANRKGWIGADGNYSVPMSPGRILWFFSDTWLGEVIDNKRVKPALINNSVGVQTLEKGTSRIEYFWGKTADGKPAAQFIPDDGKGWFWPLGGAYEEGRVHLFAWQMEKAKGAPGFGFRMVASWHLEISNPEDAPTKWRVKQRKLPFGEMSDKRRLLFGSAVMRHGDHVHIYGTEERPGEKGFGRRMVVARVGRKEVGDHSRWCFWDGEAWADDWKKLRAQAEGMAAEYSVTWVPGVERFVAVCHDVFLSPKIVARTAPSPQGPWSKPVALFTCPEPGRAKGHFCYSGKAHPWLSGKDELVLTYAVNSTRLADVINDARLYWPRFVRVKLVGGK